MVTFSKRLFSIVKIKRKVYRRTVKMGSESNVNLHVWHGIRVTRYCVFCVPRWKNSVSTINYIVTITIFSYIFTITNFVSYCLHS